jgi:succinylglutamate desuccinylase
MTLATDQRRIERTLGDLGDRSSGPLLVAVAGLHGNEPAGVHALRRVVARIEREGLELNGRFVALAGNTRALERNVRFFDLDLNRAWTRARMEALARPDHVAGTGVEDVEQRELWAALVDVFEAAAGPVICVDLHTISASGGPFATVGDTLRNRAFALQFPVPKLLGIEEQIDGGLLEWVGSLGHVTLGFEGGQHEDPDSVENHEAFAWQALEHAGLLSPSQVPDRLKHDAQLRRASSDVPRIIEVRHRHPVRPGDGFRMEPGLRHFQPVEKGTLLAHDAQGPIYAEESGYLLLPLYQGQGDDGFFLGRGVNPAWLTLSRLLRASGAPNVAHWLPGVRRKANDPTTVLVDPRVARWQAPGLFHLLGYRRVRPRGGVLEFTRRKE